MKFQLTLKTKLVLGTILITVLLFALTVGLVIAYFARDIVNTSREYTKTIIALSAKHFSLILDRDLDILRTVKAGVITFRDVVPQEEEVRELQRTYSIKVLENTPQFLSLSINWQLSYLKRNPAIFGRIRYTYYREEGRIMEKIDTLETEGDNVLSEYYKYKVSKTEGMTDPYFYKYTETQKEPILMTSLVTPILDNKQFIGLIVADIDLQHFNEVLEMVKPAPYYDNFLISHTRKFIAFTGHQQYANKPIDKFFGDFYYNRRILPNITTGQEFDFMMVDSAGNKFLVVFHPVRIGNFKEVWYVGSIVPISKIYAPVYRLIRISVVISAVLLILVLIFSYFLARSFSQVLLRIQDTIQHLAVGDIRPIFKIEHHSSDELGVIAQSINRLIDHLNRLSDFAKEIGRGNLDVKLEKASDKDILAEAFLQMQRSLKIAELEDLRVKQEEEIQRWISQGEALFAQILRDYSQDLDELAYQVISNLVKYTNSVQGGLFLINDEDPNNKYIELAAAYAYGRRKFLEKKIPLGVGLIGRAVIEGETIYITRVPEDYLSITSGLGDSHPSSLLIVPFKFNEVIYAVVELASFEGYRAHVRRFVERIGVSVASTIANVKISQQTKKLIEQLRERSQELAAQEEEMRQNLEEMRATQEELRKKAQELENIVEALNKVAYVAELNADGYLININERFLKLLKKRKEELIGRHYLHFMPEIRREQDFESIMRDLRAGHTRILKSHLAIGAADFFLTMALVPVMVDNELQKIIIIATDITPYVKAQNQNL